MQENETPKGTSDQANEGASATGNAATRIIEDRGRGDVSAATIGRMMGLATLADLTILDKKVELLVSKINLLVAKVDKVTAALQQVPTGSDLERIDVQIGALKVLIKDVLVTKSVEKSDEGEEKPLGANIVSNSTEPKE